MPTDYHHGVRVTEIADGIRSIRVPSTAVVGIVCTAADADAATFPIDTPVLVTNMKAARAKAGTQGTLSKTLAAISSQCDPLMVVVRVTDSGTVATRNTAVIGGVNASGLFTGMQALLGAQSTLGVKPRILACPGLDTLPVATALASVAQKARGMAYVAADGATTKEAATTYRNNFGQREIMVLWPDFTAWDSVANASSTLWATAVAVGLRAKLDEEVGWHKTLSNIPVNGVTGLSRSVYFDLQSTATDADYLNSHEVTCLINAQGFRFWGSRTASNDPLFAFENYTRTAQVIADMVAENHMWAVDKPMSAQLVKDILAGINAGFRRLKAAGYIVDGQAWLDESINTVDALKAGKLTIDYDYCPVPPLEDLGFRQRITDRYLADFAARVAA
ncbi:phage tail sheath protein [Chitinimonas koreensis]|uniref:phage tail sheath protein n=1 Tax=Chitinimonas koreensis TaxID=356302 RepID=UPI00042737FE|nr:phage tail sheath protein [Chitinimonas koreensis]